MPTSKKIEEKPIPHNFTACSDVFPTTGNHPHPLPIVPATHRLFSSLHIHFRAPTFTYTPFPPFFRFFNFYHAFLRAFNYCQLFSSPTTCPHTSITSPSRFRDKPLTFEPVHSFLTPNHHSELFPCFFNRYHVFLHVPDSCQPSTST